MPRAAIPVAALRCCLGVDDTGRETDELRHFSAADRRRIRPAAKGSFAAGRCFARMAALFGDKLDYYAEGVGDYPVGGAETVFGKGGDDFDVFFGSQRGVYVFDGFAGGRLDA